MRFIAANQIDRPVQIRSTPTQSEFPGHPTRLERLSQRSLVRPVDYRCHQASGPRSSGPTLLLAGHHPVRIESQGRRPRDVLEEGRSRNRRSWRGWIQPGERGDCPGAAPAAFWARIRGPGIRRAGRRARESRCRRRGRAMARRRHGRFANAPASPPPNGQAQGAGRARRCE